MPDPSPERRVSYAQNGEDVRFWRALRHVAEPFYVEVGASDPFEDSVTAALSAEGWSGVLFEADAVTAERLTAARPRDHVVAAAAHVEAGTVRFSAGTARGLGHLAAEDDDGVEVPAVRVGDVLAELQPEAVHAMTVDVEGAEATALAGADLARWRPWVLCVEATRPNSRDQAHGEWEPLVVDAGYRYVCFDGLNRWYVADERQELAEAVATPFNVLDELLDGWTRHRDVLQQAQAAELSGRATQLSEQVGRVQAALDGARGELSHLQHQLSSVTAELASVSDQRDQAVGREQVILTSKSWRLTAPLRTARFNAGLALAGRLPFRQLLSTPAAPPPDAPLPGDDRRWEALTARVESARVEGARG